MNTTEEEVETYVVVTANNIDSIFNEKLYNIINKNVIKHSGYMSIEDKEEIVQKVLIRLYKSLKSKIRRCKEEDPKVVMETKKFYSFVKRFCINEIIQLWRKNRKEGSKKATFYEDLDYSKPMVELIDSLKYKGQSEVSDIENNFCPKCNTIVPEEICPKCGYNIVPHILNVTNLRNSTIFESNNEEENLNLEVMSEQLSVFFTPSETKIIMMLAMNMTQKDIYEEIFQEKYKNPSIVHKKIKRIKRKINSNPDIKNYLNKNLYI